MVMIMKERIKKIVAPIFLSVLCGFICGRLVYSIYEDKTSGVLLANKVYLIEDESYEDYNTMKSSSPLSNYVYYEDDGKYKTVVGMTRRENNIDKIKKVYNREVTVTEYLINNEVVNNMIDEYDSRIDSTDNLEEIKTIVLEMINIYKEQEDVKMIKIS